MTSLRCWPTVGVVAVVAAASFVAGGLTSAGADPLTDSPPNSSTSSTPAPANPTDSDLAAVPAAVACTDLSGQDFTDVEGAPARVDSVTIVAGDPSVPQEFCDIKAHAANVHFELKLPTHTWTQRFVMVACGGYCGVQSYSAVNASDAGCPRLQSGELAVATTDLGHTANAFAADGLWGLNNPTAIIDFGYLGMHKTTLAAKAIMGVFYDQPAKFNYIMGCSNGGRVALMEAQPRFFTGVTGSSSELQPCHFDHGLRFGGRSAADCRVGGAGFHGPVGLLP